MLEPAGIQNEESPRTQANRIMHDLDAKQQSPERKESVAANTNNNNKTPSVVISETSPRPAEPNVPFGSPRAIVELGYTSPRAPVGSMSKRISSPRRLDVRNLNEAFNNLEKLDRGNFALLLLDKFFGFNGFFFFITCQTFLFLHFMDIDFFLIFLLLFFRRINFEEKIGTAPSGSLSDRGSPKTSGLVHPDFRDGKKKEDHGSHMILKDGKRLLVRTGI